MDKTNRIVKICRRIEELEFLLALSEGRTQTELDVWRDELTELELELEGIDVKHNVQ